MLVLYFKCMLMNLALPSLITLSLIALLLLYVYIYVCEGVCVCARARALSFAMHGDSGSWRVWGKKTEGEGILGTLVG
jgi:hypothetical protein